MMTGKTNEGDVRNASVETGLRDDYRRWLEIYESGCNDPSWSDGININLKRNHIVYGKKVMDKEAEGRLFYDFPAEYYLPVPPEAPINWFSRDREVSSHDDSERVFGTEWAGSFPETLRGVLDECSK